MWEPASHSGPQRIRKPPQQRTSPGGGFKDKPDRTHGLFAFFNAGFGDERTSVQNYQITWGLQQVGGFFASWPNDTIAFAAGTTHVNSNCSAALATCGTGVKAGGNEFPLEAWYGWQATTWLNLKFDAQYVINPGGFSDGTTWRLALTATNGFSARVSRSSSEDECEPFGAADAAGNSPFLNRLAAMRWALRCVASMMRRSGFPDWTARFTKIRSKTPIRLKRTSRLYKVLWGP